MLYKKIFKYHVHLNCPCAEFGVYKGKTLRWIKKLSGKKVFTFDSCNGLPENWGKYKRGDFAYKYKVDYEGYFKDTIPKFNEEAYCSLSFINVDCDLYSSTIDVLEGIKDKIISGTVICFDEYLKGEDKAFKEWLNKHNRNAICIGRANHLQVAYKIL